MAYGIPQGRLEVQRRGWIQEQGRGQQMGQAVLGDPSYGEAENGRDPLSEAREQADLAYAQARLALAEQTAQRPESEQADFFQDQWPLQQKEHLKSITDPNLRFAYQVTWHRYAKERLCRYRERQENAEAQRRRDHFAQQKDVLRALTAQDPDSAEEAIAQISQSLKNAVQAGRLGAIEARDMAKSAIAQILEQQLQTLVAQDPLRGEQILKDKPYYAQIFTADERTQLEQKMTQALAKQRRADAVLSLQALDQRYAALAEAARFGQGTALDLKRLQQEALDQGHSDLAHRLGKDLQEAPWRAAIAQMTPAEQKDHRQALHRESKEKAGHSDESLGQRLAILEELQQVTDRGLTDDPLGHAARVGVIALAPLEFTKDPREALGQRRQALILAEAHYQQTMPPVTCAEAKILRDQFGVLPVQDHRRWLAGFEALGPGKAVAAVLLIDPQNAPLKGAAELITQAPQTAERLLEGAALLAVGSEIADEAWQEAIALMLEGAATPAFQAVLSQQIKALYIANAIQSGQSPSSLHKDRVQAALRQRLGGDMLCHLGQAVIPPRDAFGLAWTQAHFDAYRALLSKGAMGERVQTRWVAAAQGSYELHVEGEKTIFLMVKENSENGMVALGSL